jgi:8-oxo-dGTP pyrophosphatase MutT (NUDIX family)
MALDNAARGGMILYNSKGCVLILKDCNSEKWSFPKGAQEDSDANLLATAVRECEEESGLRCGKEYRILSSFPHLDIFNYTYYAGLVFDDAVEVVPQESEIDDYRWIDPIAPPIEDAYLNYGVRSYLKMIRQSQAAKARKLQRSRRTMAAAAAAATSI